MNANNEGGTIEDFAILDTSPRGPHTFHIIEDGKRKEVTRGGVRIYDYPYDILEYRMNRMNVLPHMYGKYNIIRFYKG